MLKKCYLHILSETTFDSGRLLLYNQKTKTKIINLKSTIMKKTITTAILGISLFATSLKANDFVVPNINPNDVIEVTNTVKGLSPFCNAILKGDIDAVKSMISLGEDVNEKSLGMTPSIFAARYNKAEILEVLIANGADIKIKCDRGMGIKKYAEAAKANEALKVIEENWKKKK